MDMLAGQTAVGPEYKIFLGAGSYEHHIPETIKQLLRRGELYTAYTPYQPEVSQGTLQAIYEYQTLVCRLLGMDVANASMYDGASALAEALLMAVRITQKRRVAVSRAVHPLYRKVVETYLRPTGFEIVLLPCGPDGRTDPASLTGLEEMAAVAVQSPNFFGCIEDLGALNQTVHAGRNAPLMIVTFTEPLAYGLYRAPGAQGADIVCGEGQSLGIARSFGGPGLGLFACRRRTCATCPEALVGKAADVEGRRGFVLTLSTREQHIRRERATSNICTNQGLCATAAAMYLASLGGSGLRRLARLNYDKAGYLKSALQAAGLTVPFDAPVFNEFVVQLPTGRYQRLLEQKILAGLPLEPFYPDTVRPLPAVRHRNQQREDLDLLVKEVTA
jgi:glycine dehydrogenase subunit 1